MSGVRARSVRLRLTVATAAAVAVIAVAAAIVTPRLVEHALVSDLLDAQSLNGAPGDIEASDRAIAAFAQQLDDSTLTAWFGPEIDSLTGSLAPTGTLDRIRSFRDDHMIVVEPVPGAIAIVDVDGSVRVVSATGTQPAVTGPRITTDQLRQLVLDLDRDPFDIDQYPLTPDGLTGLSQAIDDWVANGEFRAPPFGDGAFDIPGFDPSGLDGPGDGFVVTDLDALFDELAPYVEQPEGAPPPPTPNVPSGSADDPDDAYDADDDLAFGLRPAGNVEMIVAAPTDSVVRSVDRLRTALWAIVPLVALLTAFATWLLAGRALRPVRLITERASAIGGSTLHERVPVPRSDDEISHLATVVNDMLDRLQGDDRRRRQFVSDASHELRSPIAAIRVQSEGAIAAAPTATPVSTTELATGVLAEAERLGAVVDDLLALARHDEGIATTTSPVDLDDIVLTEARRTRRVPVDVTDLSAGRVIGRADELTRVVAHLLDNAARHAVARVAVGLWTEADRVTLVVDDDGPGVAPDERERVFERFVRLDEARSHDTGGAGLGLSVVATVVRSLGGSVTVMDSPQGGARFTMVLPTAG